MAFLSADSAINAREGILTANINGKVEVVAECKNITASVEISKTDFKALGTRSLQKKPSGWSGTGTLNIYYVTSKWTEMIVNYVKYGVLFKFTLVGTNDDPNSDIGSQTVTLSRCSIDGGDILKMGTDADYLETSYNFTFEDCDLPKKFDPYTTLS